MQPIKDNSLPKEKNGFIDIIDEGKQVSDPNGASETAKHTKEHVSTNEVGLGIHPLKDPSLL